ncbi:poly(A)-specific ribonuclease KNAG_0F02190 [Huiozyma naganishii CBS 8797]|uniref:USP domain-containing protein n=1 Tax=Huiozyma naganishii (strain ATCC MYA-139 / BCRC 22969 / CBS 8797 / KCTC 17520 / NBRC 10181 / NCYC 3082 / Yp74L-3) TaxID=1071383 RepID=J7S8E9_HUIN7|nr:hypothetical protein KNAG_0F02190 [Kazachstania naganishii CBS 8797]CCK70886.1 hypothetical protein KNAG_0F02190 [Kazachstania naganishii CBS 8797]
MNNWQHLFNNTVDLSEHLRKPYFRFDTRDKNISKVVFDTNANLLWAGDTFGCVSSYDPNLQLYTRNKGHIGGSPINDILTLKEGVLSLSEDALHMSDRAGVTSLYLTSMDAAGLSGLQAMTSVSIDSQHLIYCGGNNTAAGLSCFDLNKRQISNVMPYNHEVRFLKSNNKVIAIGKGDGTVDLLDPRSNQIVNTFNCHSDSISSLDIRENTLVTAGKSKRFYNTFADPFVNVFDLRSMKQLSPVSFSKGTTIGTGGADIVQLHPVLPTVMVVASANGSFDFIDLSNTALRTHYVHPSTDVKDLIISPSGDHLAIMEANNMVSTWTRSQTGGNFTNTPEVLKYPDFVDDGIRQQIPIDNQDYPLSSVGLPYYHEKLLSAWPYVLFKSEGTLPSHIDDNIPLSSVQTGIANANSNKQLFLNSGISLKNKKFPFHLYDFNKYGDFNVPPKYVSLKEIRKKLNAPGSNNAAGMLIFKSHKSSDVPPAYGQLPFTCGRYGSDNFDFKSYNNTRYSGLDNDVDNLYTNAVIQMYRFVPEVFNFVVGCLKNENFARASTLSELGYLYDMMNRSKGRVCRSTNFQSTLNSIPEFKAAGLGCSGFNYPVECSNQTTEVSDAISTMSTVQKFNKLLLGRLLKEEFEGMDHNTTLEQCFGLTVNSEIRSKCNHYQKETMVVPSLTVLSPMRNSLKQMNKKLNNQTILPYIESSMKRTRLTQNTCGVCGKVDTAEQELTVRNLPPLLSLELSLTESEWYVARSVRNWLSPEFYGTVYRDKIAIRPGTGDIKNHGEIFKYELNGYVARITDPLDGSSRLVTYARIFDNETNTLHWYMFNNYLVVEIPEEEALNVSYWWKRVELIVYCDAEESRKPFFSVDTYPIKYDILYRDHFANAIREGYICEYKLLSRENETPHEGSLVAIDAEFVLLNDEVTEIDRFGNKTIIKPKKSSLARLSVIRGDDGPQFGVPFMDDYIYNESPVEDYLTKYSGILPGDLDLENSPRRLVSREVAYRKVWLLMQLGCIFVGHGLSNDFKLININVPTNQIRDTAVYFLQGKRYLSLRYLSFALLGQSIQEANHDSIEDAHTALILYKKYLELKSKGTLAKVIENLYEEGRALNYKVPGS